MSDDLCGALDAVAAWMARYVAWPNQAAADVVPLWITHTHPFVVFDTTPRLFLSSAEKQSGKTRVTECAELLVRRPLPAVNTTPAALFRSITEEDPPTIILDEVDAVFGPKAPDGSEDLRALINAGHRRGKPILRCHGPNHEVREFPSFTPMMLAGIGRAPDTVEDRSVIVRMRRRGPSERVESFRLREAERESIDLRDWLVSLTGWMSASLEDSYPELPDWLTDRPADVYEPLIAIADLAGGDWPDRSRSAARVLLSERADEDSLNTKLLTEIRVIFGDERHLHTEEILRRLHALEESPWGDWQITARWLASHLRPFEIVSKNIRMGTKQAKGFEREQFSDAWSRYLADPPSQASQASDQHTREDRAVPGTALSVPTSQPRASDQRRDGGTDGTQGWAAEQEVAF